jgi:hypothetical protein
LMCQSLVAGMCLHDADAHTGRRRACRYVDKRVPIAEQLAWRSPARIDEEADLYRVHVASAVQMLDTRGSSSLISRCEAASSHGRSYRRSA